MGESRFNKRSGEVCPHELDVVGVTLDEGLAFQRRFASSAALQEGDDVGNVLIGHRCRRLGKTHRARETRQPARRARVHGEDHGQRIARRTLAVYLDVLER